MPNGPNLVMKASLKPALPEKAAFLVGKFGLKTTEVAVEWAHDHRSKINPLRDGLRMGSEVLKIRWNAWIGIYAKPSVAPAEESAVSPPVSPGPKS